MDTLPKPGQANTRHRLARQLVLLVAAVSFFSGPVRAAAQAAAPSQEDFNAFWIPASAADCEVRSATPSDSLNADSVLIYHDGEELMNMRLITVGYSRSGKPLWLKAKIDEPIGREAGRDVRRKSWSVVIHGFVIFYRPGHQPTGGHVRGMLVSESPLAALKRGEAINDGVGVKAKSFAAFLLHACRQEVLAGTRRISFSKSESEP